MHVIALVHRRRLDRVKTESQSADLQGAQEKAAAGQERGQRYCRGIVWDAGLGGAAAQDAGHACGDARASEASLNVSRIGIAKQNSLAYQIRY